VNINTIFQSEVWEGLSNYFDDDITTGVVESRWPVVRASRRGYGAASDSIDSLDPRYPTRFANPFRSFAGTYLVPLDHMRLKDPSVPNDYKEEIEATLLRQMPAFVPGSPPLLVSPPNALPYRNTSNNPYFRYQAFQKLANSITTRSNVYAIWITVGYFEVEQLPPGYSVDIYPDGCRLRSELGSDTGEIHRKRGFYVYDRSIPVGFRRGEDLNVESAILVKRFIE
jgi:hypothetical protein